MKLVCFIILLTSFGFFQRMDDVITSLKSNKPEGVSLFWELGVLPQQFYLYHKNCKKSKFLKLSF